MKTKLIKCCAFAVNIRGKEIGCLVRDERAAELAFSRLIPDDDRVLDHSKCHWIEAQITEITKPSKS